MAALSYRQQVAPENFDTRIPDNGDAALADHLGSLFGHVGDELGDLGGQLNAAQGEQEGKDAGFKAAKDRTDPGLRTGPAATLTRYGQSYNNSAVPAYVAKTQSDVQQTYAQLDSDFDNGEIDLQTYKAKSDAYVAQLNESTPQQLKSQVGFIVDAHAGAGLLRVQDAQVKKDHAEAEGSYLDAQSASADAVNKAYEVSQAAGDAAAHQAFISDKQQRDSLEASHAISPVKSAHYGKVFETTIHAAIGEGHVHSATDKLMSVARANGVSQAGHAFNDLMASKDYSDEDKQKIGAKYSAALGQYKVAQSARYAENVASLRERLAGGESGGGIKAQALAYHDKGAISDDELAGIYAESARNAKAKGDDTSLIDWANSVVDNHVALDPEQDAKHAKALDLKFQDIMQKGGMQMGDQRSQSLAMDMLNRNNVLPKSMESWARTVAVTGDAQSAALGASFITKVMDQDHNPAASKYFNDPKLQTYATNITNSLKVNVPLQQAYDLARKQVYGQTEAQRDVVHRQYTIDQKASANDDVLQKYMNADNHFAPHWWSSAPPAPFAMRAEYEDLVHKFYVDNGGSLPSAQESASKNIVKMWGVSRVNGKEEVMKYSPERWYGLTAFAVKEDIAKVLKDYGSTADPAKVTIQPNSKTDFSDGKKWTLMSIDEYGGHHAVLDSHNIAIDYHLPLSNDHGAARLKANQENVAAGIEERQQYIKDRADVMKKSYKNDLGSYSPAGVN